MEISIGDGVKLEVDTKIELKNASTYKVILQIDPARRYSRKQ